MAAKFRPRARNDDEDHRHEAMLPQFLGLSSTFAFPESASRVHSACDPGGSTRHKEESSRFRCDSLMAIT
jgi:hypothetical protein